MARLVTDDLAKRIAGELYLARPLPMARDDFAAGVRQAIEHDLTDMLEGLLEPEEAS